MSYDSTEDTKKHIEKVAEFIGLFLNALAKRILYHDQSKLLSPEKEIFDEFTPKLKGSTYGSEEYKGFLKEMGAALEHHYKENRHHPEHFTEEADATFRSSPVNCMNLIDLVEMLCDWKAATLRHENGNILQSIGINKERFGLSIQLASILENTVKDLGWVEK